jgi:hypothetical protein
MKEKPFLHCWGWEVTTIQQSPVLRVGDKITMSSNKTLQTPTLKPEDVMRYLKMWSAFERREDNQEVHHDCIEAFQIIKPTDPNEIGRAAFSEKKAHPIQR